MDVGACFPLPRGRSPGRKVCGDPHASQAIKPPRPGAASVRQRLMACCPALERPARRRYHRSAARGGHGRDRDRLRAAARARGRRPTAARRSTASRCATTPGRSRSAPSAPSAASPSASASTSCSRSSHHTAAERRRRRQGDLLRHDHRGDRGASSPPSGSTCSRPWPSGSRPAASPIRGRCGSSCASRSSTASPGALGVEIVRTPAAARRRAAAAGRRRRRRGRAGGRGSSISPPRRRGRRPPPGATRWRGCGGPLVVCLGPAAPQPPAASEAQRRIGLLAIEQAAWAFADARPALRASPASRTELDWALKSGRLVGLGAGAHGRPRRSAAGVPDASDPAGARRLARRARSAPRCWSSPAPPAPARHAASVASPAARIRNPG